jgi:tetratricopeptide (TPR) repeat protein
MWRGDKQKSHRFLNRVWTLGALLLAQVCLAITTQEALQQADQLIRQRRFDEAEHFARLALPDPGTAPLAYAVLGALQIEKKNFSESIVLLERAIRLEPRLVGARLNLAQAYSLLGKSAEAVSTYRGVLEFDPSNETARLAVANALADAGHYRKSIETATPVIGALKRSPDGLLVLARDFTGIGDRASAAALVADWQKIPDVPVEYSVRFALALAKGGLLPEATDVLEHAKQNGATSYDLDFNLASVWLMRGDLGKAQTNYELAATSKPDFVRAMVQSAQVAERRGELERALSWWIRAKKLRPDDPDILFGFGRVCLKMDLLSDAEPALVRATELRPEQASYQYVLASARVGKKQFESAELLLRKLVAKQPNDPQLHYALGSVFYLESKLDESERELRESLRLQPNQLASLYYLGLTARDQGKTAEAVRIFQELLQTHPNHAPSYEALGMLQVAMQRYPEAEQNLSKAVELNPNSAKSNYQLGLLLGRLGKKEAAAKRFEIAKSLRQEDEAESRLQLRLLDPEQ